MCCVKNVGLSKAVYLLLENTKIDAVAFIILTAKLQKKRALLKNIYNSILDCFRHFSFLQWTVLACSSQCS